MGMKIEQDVVRPKNAGRSFYEAVWRDIDNAGLTLLRYDTAVLYGKIDQCDTWAVTYVDELLFMSAKSWWLISSRKSCVIHSI